MRIWSLWTLTLILVAVPAFGNVVAPNLALAFDFGLLAGTISNTGTSVVTGNASALACAAGSQPRPPLLVVREREPNIGVGVAGLRGETQ